MQSRQQALRAYCPNIYTVVLDDGRVVEFDTPSKLLENSEGYLSQMVNQSGSRVKKKLVQMAHGELK